MKDKIFKTIIIVVAIIATAYVLSHISWGVKFEDDPIVKMPDYSDYDKRPNFRVVTKDNQYYISFKVWDSKDWNCNNISFPTREDAQAVIEKCKRELKNKYNRLCGTM